MSNQVVITGYAAMAATGDNINEIWESLIFKDSGIANNFPEYTYSHTAAMRNKDPKNLLKDKKIAKMVSPHDIPGIVVADAAVEHSGLLAYRNGLSEAEQIAFNESTGIFVASAGTKFSQQYDFLPLIENKQTDLASFSENLDSTVHPMWLLRILPNNVLAYVSIENGFKGPNENICNHGASGVQAILEAYHLIAQGKIDRAVVVAYDNACSEQELFYYGKLGVLGNSKVASFGPGRNGTVLGEAAAAIILESKDSAVRRGAHCYSEILGGATTTDAEGIFSLDETGENLAVALQQALEHAGMSPEQIDLVCAHGNGTVKSDASEAAAITQTFQHQPAVTAYKWSIGHTLTTAGVIETILSSLALQEGKIPPLRHTEMVAPDCLDINISQYTRRRTLKNACVISRGFSGLNACLVMSAS